MISVIVHHRGEIVARKEFPLPVDYYITSEEDPEPGEYPLDVGDLGHRIDEEESASAADQVVQDHILLMFDYVLLRTCGDEDVTLLRYLLGAESDEVAYLEVFGPKSFHKGADAVGPRLVDRFLAVACEEADRLHTAGSNPDDGIGQLLLGRVLELFTSLAGFDDEHAGPGDPVITSYDRLPVGIEDNIGHGRVERRITLEQVLQHDPVLACLLVKAGQMHRGFQGIEELVCLG